MCRAGAADAAQKILKREAGEQRLRTGQGGALFRAGGRAGAASFLPLFRQPCEHFYRRKPRKPEPRRTLLVHDLHATILHLLGFDHQKLTYRYAGRDFRLTDVSGEVVKEILA